MVELVTPTICHSFFYLPHPMFIFTILQCCIMKLLPIFSNYREERYAA